MSGRIFRWAAAFAATALLAGSLLHSAFRTAPSAAAVTGRDPSLVGDVELELILHRIREGDLLSEKPDLPAAKRSWREARRLGEGLWPIHEGLGDSYVRAKLPEEALEEYQIAERLVPEKLAELRLKISAKRAAVLGIAGRPLEAIGVYLDINLPARTGASILDLTTASNAEAVLKLVSDRARVYDPRLFLLLSRIHIKLNRKAEAAEALASYCIAVAPWEESLNRQAVEGLRELRRFDRAVEVCRAWVRSTPQALQAYVVLGDVLRDAGREQEALRAYTSIIDVRPGDSAVRRQLGDLLHAMKRDDEAIGQYEAARKARPEDQATYAGLVALYDVKGRPENSEAILKEAIRRFGTAGELGARLVASYEQQIAALKAAGKRDEARVLRRKLGELQVTEAGLFDLKVIMTWDVESDVDLDVFEPGDEHLDHSHPQSKLGGRYYVDNTKGFGPETYTLPAAAPGTYRIGAHLHGSRRSTVKFVVILYEDTAREERREETLVIDKDAKIFYIRDIVISR